MKYLKIVFFMVVCTFVFVLPCSAQVYTSNLPSYCPNSGSAFAEVNTSQGRACICVGCNYISNVFSFYGSSGYNVMNCTSNTINGRIYFKNKTSYYQNPTNLQCRFLDNGTLEIYEPYQGSYNNVSYRWTSLPTNEVFNTNIAFVDNSTSDRQNNDFIYLRSEKLQIIVICLLIAILLYYLLGKAWRA